MAKEFIFQLSTSQNVYTVIRNAVTGDVANITLQTFGAWSLAADHAVTTTVDTGLLASADMPTWVPVGTYFGVCYHRAGASPANGDSVVATQEPFYWDGTVSSSGSSVSKMSLSQLVTEVQSLTGRTGDIELVTTARTTRWLNEAQLLIVKRCLNHLDLETDWTTGITMVAGTYSYDISSLSPLLVHLFQLFYMNGSASKEIVYVDTKDFDRDYPSPLTGATGIPFEYTRRGGTIEVYPVPSSSEAGQYIRLCGTRTPTAFLTSSTSATCDMSDADNGLVYYAVSEAFKAIGGKADESVSYRQYFEEWLDRYQAQKDGYFGLGIY